MKRSEIFIALVVACAATSTRAHDTWVQTNTNVIRTGDAVHIDLMLGNHGNDHRDYKLASKIGLEGCRLAVYDPAGERYDLVDRLNDTGYTPKEGYWTTKFAARTPGLYLVEHSMDRIVNHGRPIRSVRSAKTFFVVSNSLDRVPFENPGFDKRLGHPLELIPNANPVTPMGPGKPISLRLLFKGEPLSKGRVSFVPRGEKLAAGFDENFERTTDSEGRAEFTPTAGNYYLVVAHHKADNEHGDGYDATQYTAALTVFVPEVCPCCGE